MINIYYKPYDSDLPIVLAEGDYLCCMSISAAREILDKLCFCVNVAEKASHPVLMEGDKNGTAFDVNASANGRNRTVLGSCENFFGRLK
jgi:hypothetical protein